MVLMALLVFVGCEQASFNFPKYVVSADVRQTQDFLVGQAFDPSKFEVTVYYSDGSSSVLEGQNISTGNTECALGMTASVNAGLNKDGSAYNKTFAVNVYEATGVTVTAPETVTVANNKATTLDAKLFTVVATYANGSITLLPTADYTVSVDASEIAAGATKTVIATIKLGSIYKNVPVNVSVTNAAVGEPVTPLDEYVWNNQELAYSVSASAKFNRGAFDPEDITLYRVYRKTATAQLSDGYYLVPVDSDDVVYAFTTTPVRGAKNPATFPAEGTEVTLKFLYSYVDDADEGTTYLSTADDTKVTVAVDPAKYTADEEGRLIPNGADSYTVSKEIKMTLRPDYITGVTVAPAETEDEAYMLYVGTLLGEDVANHYVVTADFASGYVADSKTGNVLAYETGYKFKETTATTAAPTIVIAGPYAGNALSYDATVEFNSGIEVVDYPVAITGTLKTNVGEVLVGDTLSPSAVDWTVEWKSGVKNNDLSNITIDENTQKLTKAGEVNYIGFGAHYALKADAITSTSAVAVTPVDYPVSIISYYAGEGVTFSKTAGEEIAASDLALVVAEWASGNTNTSSYSDAPAIEYSFNGEAPKAGEAGAQVTISNLVWKCSCGCEHTGSVPSFTITMATV